MAQDQVQAVALIMGRGGASLHDMIRGFYIFWAVEESNLKRAVEQSQLNKPVGKAEDLLLCQLSSNKRTCYFVHEQPVQLVP